MTTARSGVGVYGFRIEGVSGSGVLREARPDWPVLEVVRTGPDPGRSPPPELADLVVADGHAELWLSPDEFLEVTRDPLRVRFAMRTPLSDDLVAHPFLGLPTAVANHWLGRQVLHGGGFLRDGRAWGVLGTKEVGKSSTLAQLRARGHDIVTDDLLVVDGDEVLAGPATIDLRADASVVLGGEQLVVGEGRARWRIRPGAVPPASPLAGIIHLDWGDDVVIEAVPPGERLVLLIANSVLGPDLVDAAAYLALAALPTTRFVRPRRLDLLESGVDQLLAALP